MKIQYLSTIVIICLSSCNAKEDVNNTLMVEDTETKRWSQEKFLVHSDSTYAIDLTDLNMVSNNLNGYWVSENRLKETTILWLTYDDTNSISFWTQLEFSEEVISSKEFILPSCQDIGELIMFDNSVHIAFSGVGRKDTVKITEMNNEKFTISKETYLRHQGLP